MPTPLPANVLLRALLAWSTLSSVEVRFLSFLPPLLILTPLYLLLKLGHAQRAWELALQLVQLLRVYPHRVVSINRLSTSSVAMFA